MQLYSNKRVNFVQLKINCNLILDAFQRPLHSVAHPGVAQNFEDDEGKQKHYTYYQWVCVVDRLGFKG